MGKERYVRAPNEPGIRRYFGAFFSSAPGPLP